MWENYTTRTCKYKNVIVMPGTSARSDYLVKHAVENPAHFVLCCTLHHPRSEP